MHTAGSQGRRLERRHSCSNIRRTAQAGQKGEKQFDVNDCREPNFQVFGVARSSKKDTLNCVETIAMEESLLPATQENVKNSINPVLSLFPHRTHVTGKDTYTICDATTMHTHTVAP